MIHKVLIVVGASGLSFVSMSKDFSLNGTIDVQAEIRREYRASLSNRIRAEAEKVTVPFLFPKENEDVLISGRVKMKAEEISVTYVWGGVTNEWSIPSSVQEDICYCSVITTRTDTVLYSLRNPAKDRIGPYTKIDNYTKQQDVISGDFPMCTIVIGTNLAEIVREKYRLSGNGVLLSRYMYHDKDRGHDNP